MRHRLSTTFLLLLASAAASAAPAQESDGMQKIRRTFSQADRNADGFLDPAEAKRATIPSADFLAQDHDGDRRLSADEFLLYYRGLLVSAKLSVPADVDQWAERIEAAREKAAQEEARRRRAAAAKTDAEGEVDVERRLERAQNAVRDEAGRGELSRAEAKQKKDQLVVRARQALRDDAPQNGGFSPTVADKLRRVEAALETQVAAGKLTRAEAAVRMQLLRDRAQAVTGRSRTVAQRVVREADAQDAALARRERARAAQGGMTASERQKLDAKLKQLDEALAAGKLTAAQHAQQRKSMIERAEQAGRVGLGAGANDKQRLRGEGARRKFQDDQEIDPEQVRAEAARIRKERADQQRRDEEQRKADAKAKEASEEREAERQRKARDEERKAKREADAKEREERRKRREQRGNDDGDGYRDPDKDDFPRGWPE